jgi:osmotically-inducible protein OsmY
MENTALQSRVEAELQWEPSIDASEIGVAVANGVVTLSGAVRTYAEKTAAERSALRIKGVRGVAQEIEVRPFGDIGVKDDEIAKRALRVMQRNTAIPRDAIQVKVEDGRVTLSGDVDWNFERETAERVVQGLYGVRAVANQIKVKPKVQADNVHRRIEDALERQSRVDAGKIRVFVDGHKVRLEGKVAAWSDRSTIEHAAWSAPGVTMVEDRVTIAG